MIMKCLCDPEQFRLLDVVGLGGGAYGRVTAIDYLKREIQVDETEWRMGVGVVYREVEPENWPMALKDDPRGSRAPKVGP